MSTMKKRIERPFTVLSADLSMNRPAFALLRCTDCGVELLGKRNIPRSATEHLHGPTLDRLYKTLPGQVKHADVLVRERGFSRFRNETQALFKIVGITDLVAWQTKELVFDEIAPKSVKKVVAGSGDASKDEVAAALTWFVGEQEYECDDESDSVAVGIAWLILNGYIMGENDVSKDD